MTAKTKADIITELTANFPDNSTGLITPAILRTTMTDVVDSYQQYAAVNAQTGTSYTVLTTDYGKLITFNNASAVAVTLAQAIGSFSPFNFYAVNNGVGTVTITPTTSTIDGTTLLTLVTGAGAYIISDGTNWQVFESGASGSSGVQSVNGETGGLTLRAQSGGRLTLSSGIFITSTDVIGATSLYYTPGAGNQFWNFNGATIVPVTFTEAQMTLALDSSSGHAGYQQSGKNLDVFGIVDSGTNRLGTGPIWNAGAVAGSDVARGTGVGSTELEFYLGQPVNKNAITIRWGSASGNTTSVPARQATYLGTIRMTADGVTEDSLAKRFVWNCYNQSIRPMNVQDSTATWVYSTPTWRQARATATNQLAFVTGLGGVRVSASASVVVNSATAASSPFIGIGVNSSTVTAATGGGLVPTQVAGGNAFGRCEYTGFPGSTGIGYTELRWLEQGNNAGSAVQTWFGSAATFWASGISGELLG